MKFSQNLSLKKEVAMNLSNTKDLITTKLDGHSAFNYYLSAFHKFQTLKPGQNISNPFLERVQKTPSFNIYQNEKGVWRFKDFSTDDHGDIFDLVQRLKHCGFKEAIRIIANDFNIDISEHKKSFVHIEFSDWNDETLKYWSQHGISESTLKAFNTQPVRCFHRDIKGSKPLVITSNINEPIFSYRIAENAYKIYNPFEKKYRFSWLGDKPTEYVFGLNQLPKSIDTVFITGGEKDVMTLHSRGYAAICLNSETSFPSDKLMTKLKLDFENVIILYDLDDTGIKQSEKIAKSFKIQRMILPSVVTQKGGKDVSDLYFLGFDLNHPDIEINDFNDAEKPGEYIPIMLKTQKELTKRKGESIAKTLPILTYGDFPVIFPRTINIIQGKSGVHKSRLAETICSTLIKKTDYNKTLLGFKANMFERPTVCYVDTERNLSEQFPLALQQILEKGGYAKEDTPQNFDYISLLEIPRKDRFKALNQYLIYVRKMAKGHIVIILDVVTDCIKDFNRSEDSMQLIDLMNEAINKFNVTFISLIHENPGSADKARGHLGSELMNKSSSVMQVKFEMGKNGQPSDIIAINFLKARSTRKLDPIYIQYCSKEKGLVIADPSDIADVVQSRQLKASIEDIIEFLPTILTEPLSNQDLMGILTKEFGCSTKIVRERLTDLHKSGSIFNNQYKEPCRLNKSKKGKEIMYELVPVREQDESAPFPMSA